MHRYTSIEIFATFAPEIAMIASVADIYFLPNMFNVSARPWCYITAFRKLCYDNF